MAEENVFDQLEQEDNRLKAQSILYKDNINQGYIKMDSALADFIANAQDASSHKEAFEDMSRVGQVIESFSGGVHNFQVSEAALDSLDALDDLKSVRDWNNANREAENDVEQGYVDAQAAWSGFNKQNEEARKQILEDRVQEYRNLVAEGSKYVRPKAIDRMVEKTKGMGLLEGLGVAYDEFSKDDALGNLIYLAGSSMGAMTPALAMSAVTSGGVGALAKLPLAARTLNAAIMGAWDTRASYAGELQERLREEGVDLTNANAWEKLIEKGAKLDDIRRASSGKAAVIGGVSALSLGAATMTLRTGDLWRKLRGMAPYNAKSATLTGRLINEGDALLTGTMAQGAMGAAGEALGSYAIGEDPNAAEVFMEFIGELGSGPIEMGMQSLSTINQFRRDQDAAEQAQRESQVMKKVTEAASAIGQRIGENEAVDTWAQRVGKDREFHAFAQDLVTNGQVELIAQVKPELAEQIVQAAEEGGDVTISAGDIISIATKDKALADNILEDCRTDVSGMSPRQAEDFVKNGQKEADQLFEKTVKKYKVTVDQAKSAHRVGQRIKQELINAGTRQDIAAAQVKPLEMYLVRMAGQLGIDPEKAVDEMGLRVVRAGNNKVGVAFASPATQGKYWRMGPQKISPDSLLDVLYVTNLVEEDRKTTLEKFESTFSKGLRNNQTGWIFTSSYGKGKRSYGASGSSKAFVLRNIIPIMDKVVANSVLIESHRDVDHKSDNVKSVHVFAAPVQIGEKIWRVEFKVKDIREWHRKDNSLNEYLNVHSVDSIEVKEIKKASHDGLNGEASSEVDVPVAPHQPTAPTAAGQPRTIDFSEFINGVNPFVRKDGRGFFDEVDEDSYKYNDENPDKSGAYALMWSFGQNDNPDSQQRRGGYVPNVTSTPVGEYAGLIELMETADESTFMHESSHFFLDMDMVMANRLADKVAGGENLTEGEAEFLRNLGGFLKWGQDEGAISLGVDDTADSVMLAAQAWKQLSMDDQRAMHELFAEGFESYLMTGKAPNNSVRDLFERFKEWLLDVYATATRKPRPISKEVEKLYSLMFATEQEIAEVEAANGMIPMFDLEFEREEKEAAKKGVKLSKEERAAYRKLHKEAQLEAQGIVSKAVAGVMNYYVKLRDSAAKKIIKENKNRIEERIDALLEEPRYVAYSILTNGLTRDGKKLRFKLAPESLRAEGYSEETIQALAEKGLVYGRNNLNKQLSPNRLAEMAGADDVMQLLKDLAEGTKAKARSPLARARDFLGWSGGYKLSVRELKSAGADDSTIAKLIERDIAYDSSLRSDTTNSVALAEMAGHDSPVELIAELVDIQEPRIEAASQIAAEIQMETGETPERYTELQANLAAHTKARSRLLHAEYNAIARMLGQRQLAVYAAREYAKKKLEGVRFGDVKANAYIAAERRCARDAERAFVKGDFQACLDAKRGQILNHEMARIALEIEDSLVKAKRAAKRAMKSKGLYKPYQRLLARMVAAHNLEKVPGKLERTLSTQDNAMEELVEEGYYAQGDNPVEQALKTTTDIKDMTVADARAYLETVKELTTIARNRLKQNLIEAAERIDEIVERGVEELDKAVAEQKVAKPLNETAKSTWGKRFQGLKSFFFDHVKAQALCRIFDRDQDNGFFWNLFIRSANERAAFENEERAKVTQKLDEIFSPIFGTKSAYTQDKQRIGNKLMSKGERFAAACNLGNASNIQRLRDGDPKQWTDENIEALKNSLTAKEWLAVQAVWDLLESYRPMIAEKQMRVYGEEPQWIEPQELTVVTADDEVLTLRGGYYPVKYDPKAGSKAGGFDAVKDAESMMKGAFQSQTTSRSFVKERVKNPNMGPLLLDMSGLFTGLNDVIHDLAWHEWLIETGRVLRGAHGRDTGLDAAIRERYGDDQAKLLNNWRTNIAVGDRVEGDVLSSLVRGRAGISLMGWSLTSAAVQLTGIGYVVPRCGAANTLKALKHVLKNPIKARRDINEVSSAMKLRGLTANKTISEIRNRIQDGKAPWWKEHALTMLLAVQALVDTICWYAAYGKALQDPNVMNAIDPDKTAIAVADQSVTDTQGSGNVHEMSNIENDPNKQLWTVFYSWASTALNQTLAIYKGENDRKSAWAKLFWMGVIMPTVEKLFRDALQAEDEDEDDELDPMKMLRIPLGASVEYHLGLFVYSRELANVAGAKIAGEHAYSYGGPAGTRGIAAVNQVIASAGGNEEDGFFTWSMLSTGVNLTGALTGIPSAQINRTIKGLRAVESGQAEGVDALLAPVFGFQGRIKD